MSQLYDIPGIRAEIVDGGMRIVAPNPDPKVTVIGVANTTNLAVNEPYSLDSASDIQSLYNSDGTVSELAKAAAEAYSGGATNVEAMLISTLTGIDADSRYIALEAAYNILLNHNVDIVTVAGVTIDTPCTGTGRNFGYQLAKFGYECTINHRGVLGTIGVVSPVGTLTGVPTLAEINDWVDALYAFDTTSLSGSDFTIYDGITAGGDGVPNTYAFYATSDGEIPTGTPPLDDSTVLRDTRNHPIDLGAYLSVAAMHVRQTGAIARDVSKDMGNTAGYYFQNGAASYAGMIAATPFNIGTTNSDFPLAPSRKLSIQQLEKLRKARFVTVTTKDTGNKILKGMTGAYYVSRFYKSDYTDLLTVRTVQATIEAIRTECDMFIGRPYNVVNRNAMEEKIDSILAGLIELGVLNGGDFDIIATSSMRTLGEVIIELTLDVAIELDNITVRISLVPPGTIGQ